MAVAKLIIERIFVRSGKPGLLDFCSHKASGTLAVMVRDGFG